MDTAPLPPSPPSLSDEPRKEHAAACESDDDICDVFTDCRPFVLDVATAEKQLAKCAGLAEVAQKRVRLAHLFRHEMELMADTVTRTAIEIINATYKERTERQRATELFARRQDRRRARLERDIQDACKARDVAAYEERLARLRLEIAQLTVDIS